MAALPSYLTSEALDALISRALAEDVGPGDATTLATIPAETMAEASFVAKEEGVLAGLHVAERVFTTVDDALHVEWYAQEGDVVGQDVSFGTVQGRAQGILTGERLALNLLQRMSGIASHTRAMVRAARPHKARILDTRKTVPGLRALDKWAVKLGGGENHRIGLYDMILIKDNHIAAAGGIPSAIRDAQRYRDAAERDLRIEIEARTLEEVEQVLETGGVDIILLDNMARLRPDGTVDTSMLGAAVGRIAGRVATEASGNVTLQTVGAIAATGVDYISCGALTHSVRALDLSLQITL